MAKKSSQTAKEVPGLVDVSPEDQLAIFGDSIPAFYANRVAVSGSQHDARITFGRFGAPGTAAKYEVAVYLSYPTLKQTIANLVNLLGVYETQFGEVPIEPKAVAKK